MQYEEKSKISLMFAITAPVEDRPCVPIMIPKVCDTLQSSSQMTATLTSSDVKLNDSNRNRNQEHTSTKLHVAMYQTADCGMVVATDTT